MIPDFKTISIQVLNILRDNKDKDAMTASDFRKPLVDFFKLTKEDITAVSSKSKSNKLLRKIALGLSILYRTGLAEKPKMGYYKISEKGVKLLLTKKTEEIEEFIKDEISSLYDKPDIEQTLTENSISNESNNTTEEDLDGFI